VGERTISGKQLSRRYARQVLEYLLVARDRRANKEDLIDRLWPDVSITAASNRLYMAVHALRGLIEPDRQRRGAGAVLTAGDSLELDVTRWWIDLDEFKRCTAVTAGREVDVVALKTAVDLYRGPLFADENQADWLVPHREEIRTRYAKAVLSLAQAWADAAAYTEAIDLLTAFLRDETTQEAAHRQLMRLYAMTGQRSEALRQFDMLARALAEGLGVKPDQDSVRLIAAIRAGTVGTDEFAAPARISAETILAAPAPMPASSEALESACVPMAHWREGPIVGRAAELQSLRNRVLEFPRLRLVVHGPAGIGKSTLAHTLARQLVGQRKTLLLDLSSAAAQNFIASGNAAKAAARGVDTTAEAILLVDGVAAADCAPLVPLLSEWRGPVLAFSRMPWPALTAAQLQLQPLELPASGSELNRAALEAASATALFLAVNDACGGPAIDDEVVAVVDICRLVDGLPGAIEFAARKMRTHSLKWLRDRLTRDTAQFFAQSGRRKTGLILDGLAEVLSQFAPQTVQAAAALAVCSSSIDMDAVARIAGIDAGAADDAIEELCEAGLAAQERMARTDALAPPRFHLLRLAAAALRSMGATAPGHGGPDPLQGHAEYFGGQVARGRRILTKDASLASVADDIHRALVWSVDAGRGDLVIAICAAMMPRWAMAGCPASVRDALGKTLMGELVFEARVRGAAAHALSVDHCDAGRLQDAQRLAEVAADCALECNDIDASIEAATSLARALRLDGHLAEALQTVSHAKIEGGGEEALIGRDLERASCLLALGRPTEAQPLVVGHINRLRRSGPASLLARALLLRARASIELLAADSALIYLDEVESIVRAADLALLRPMVLCQRGSAYLELARYDLAEEAFRTALETAAQSEQRMVVSIAMRGLGLRAMGLKDFGAATHLFTQAALVAERSGLRAESRRAWRQLAVAQLACGDNVAAEYSLRQAIELGSAESPRETAALLHTASICLDTPEDPRLARALRRMAARLHDRLGLVAPALDDAQSHLEAALDLARAPATAPGSARSRSRVRDPDPVFRSALWRGDRLLRGALARLSAEATEADPQI
jgi:DNA-binding SARP family transcriptional activator/DNA polymerase III delta prime subunit